MICLRLHRSAGNIGGGLSREVRTIGGAAALGLFVAACGSSAPTAPTPPSTPPLTLSMTDSAGDTLPDSRVAAAPDLVGGVVEVDGTNLRFRVTLTSSLDRSTAGLQIHLDLDENPNTGIQGIQNEVDFGVVGAEGVLELLDGLQRVQLIRCNATSCQIIGPYPTTLTGSVLEGMIPMSAIADDGRMSVKMSTLVSFNGIGSSPRDVMPDIGQPAPHVR